MTTEATSADDATRRDGSRLSEGLGPTARLVACPFCGGPPVATATKAIGGGGVFRDAELDAEAGLYVRAFVFCHECGAEGENFTGHAYDRDDVAALTRQAVYWWNTRDSRHSDLYEAAAAMGLNCWPRA
jgi:hypothetical protein